MLDSSRFVLYVVSAATVIEASVAVGRFAGGPLALPPRTGRMGAGGFRMAVASPPASRRPLPSRPTHENPLTGRVAVLDRCPDRFARPKKAVQEETNEGAHPGASCFLSLQRLPVSDP